MDSKISTPVGADCAGAVHSKDLLCHVRMFKPEFAPLIASGFKCQTVRPTPKRMPKSGDRISLRMWTGKPYRSKQRLLREATIESVQPIRLEAPYPYLWISVNGENLSNREAEAFARADGFQSLHEMKCWFEATHGLPFDGVVIKWHNDPSSATEAMT